MRCLSPRTVGFLPDGKTLCWSQKHYSKEYATFQLPCSKCLECRLEYGRQWAVRCIHEAQMYGEKNSFITLTYDQEHLPGPKLVYRDFQLFIKKLRKIQNDPIGVFVTGEYGDQNKRPHWHAIIFNWRPTDPIPDEINNKTGDQTYTSETLTKIWANGKANFGSVTYKSAGYVARYAAKKLIHGADDDHEFHPISKKSSKHAIGKKWLEQFWPDAFNHGEIHLKDEKTGQINKSSIPRYYEKWLKQHQPNAWLRYVTQVKIQKSALAQQRTDSERLNETLARLRRRPGAANPVTRLYSKIKNLEAKFELLQKGQKC